MKVKGQVIKVKFRKLCFFYKKVQNCAKFDEKQKWTWIFYKIVCLTQFFVRNEITQLGCICFCAEIDIIV